MAAQVAASSAETDTTARTLLTKAGECHVDIRPYCGNLFYSEARNQMTGYSGRMPSDDA